MAARPREDRVVRAKRVCREHDICRGLLRLARQAAGGAARTPSRARRSAPQSAICESEWLRASARRKAYELEVAGEACEAGVKGRVARSREPVANGARRSWRAYRRSPTRRSTEHPAEALAQRQPAKGPVDATIVDAARENPTDGGRMLAAVASRELGRPLAQACSARHVLAAAPYSATDRCIAVDDRASPA